MHQLQVIQAIYQAFGRGDVPAILDHLAEDVEWEHDAVDHGIPWLKPGRGKAHVLAFFGEVGGQLAITKFEVRNLIEGGGQVVAIIEIEAEAKRSRIGIRDYELHVWTFGNDGKVARFRHVVDTHQHWLASRG